MEFINQDIDNYLKHVSTTYQNLYTNRQFSDVTLISDDNEQSLAHKFILSSSSKTFSEMLKNLDQVNPFVVLKGVKKKDMDAMLQFCYLGQVNMELSNMNQFIKVMEDYDIIGLNQISMEEEKYAFETIKENKDILTNCDVKMKEEKHENWDWENSQSASVEEETPLLSESDTNQNVPKGKAKKKGPKMETKVEDITDRKCRDCEYIATKKSSLKEHVKRIHLKMKDTISCEICGKIFGSKSALHLHKQQIHEKIMYTCKEENCNFSARSRQYLKFHVESKHENKRYFCDKCNHTTFNKHLLKMHEAVHLDEKPNKCDQCDYKSIKKGALKVHFQSVHEGKKLSCSHCEFKTAYSYNLKSHIQKVHGKEPFMCEKCPFSTTMKRTLVSHYDLLHPNDVFLADNKKSVLEELEKNSSQLV